MQVISRNDLHISVGNWMWNEKRKSFNFPIFTTSRARTDLFELDVNWRDIIFYS